MTYYKVKPQFNNVQILKTRRNHLIIDGFLIANELYTKAELSKLITGATFRGCGVNDNTVIFDKVEINRNKTYYFFGARFASDERR